MGDLTTAAIGGQRAADAGELYTLHFDLLRRLASRKFGVPPEDAEGLVHEVFITFLSSTTQIRDVRAWLVGAICNASRHYWRMRGKTESSLPDDLPERSDPASHRLAEKLALQITLRETLARLHPKCRDTLRLHYYEGRSAIEVARALETTHRYAEKLIHKCLKRAHEMYASLTRR